MNREGVWVKCPVCEGRGTMKLHPTPNWLIGCAACDGEGVRWVPLTSRYAPKDVIPVSPGEAKEEPE